MSFTSKYYIFLSHGEALSFIEAPEITNMIQPRLRVHEPIFLSTGPWLGDEEHMTSVGAFPWP